jgi:hypothetical protein
MAYRPIFRVSVYIDALLFGQHAVPWHIENIVIHAANALLLAAVMRAFRLPRGLCAAAALLFLVAPHNSESIDWISGRTAALSFLFMELAAWRWVLAVRDRRMPWAAAIWMLMSAGTYEPGVALPVILLCLVPLLAKTIDVDWRYAARQTLPLFLSLAVFLIFRGFMLGTPVGETAPTNMNLLENSSDHLAALWRANLATGTAISRWVLIVAVLVTSLHPRLFPAGPASALHYDTGRRQPVLLYAAGAAVRHGGVACPARACPLPLTDFGGPPGARSAGPRTIEPA